MKSASGTIVLETASPSEAAQAARQAAEDDFELVIAAGGDGAVSAVANGLAAATKRTTLGVLPLGTANDFAFSLSIPDELELAYSLLTNGQVRPLDLVEMEVGGQRRYYINVAAGGNSDRVTASLSEEMKKAWGSWVYLRGALGVLADLTSYQATVAFDDEPSLELALWNVIVANGRTNAGRLVLAPHASLEDGLMDVVLIRDGTVLDLASLASQFVLSDYLQSEQVVFRQVRSLSIRANPPIRFSVDGEALADPPEMFRVKPQMLRVIVGDEYQRSMKQLVTS
jgi:diacylglycerol kinase (ATP)